MEQPQLTQAHGPDGAGAVEDGEALAVLEHAGAVVRARAGREDVERLTRLGGVLGRGLLRVVSHRPLTGRKGYTRPLYSNFDSWSAHTRPDITLGRNRVDL